LTAEAETDRRQTVWELFVSGGPVMVPLLACSLVALTVVIERAMFWVGVNRRSDPALLNEVLTLCESGDWEAVRLRTAGTRDFVIRILITGILHRDFSMTKAMESAAADQVKRMRRFLGVLDTMITVAPLLGIFGTVIGIIHSFEAFGAAGVERPAEVTAGIAQALITTAAGLGIAIAALIPYNIFDSLCDRAALRIERYATSLEIVYEKLAQAPGGSGAGPPPIGSPSGAGPKGRGA
jgi:biopolymer transport protein ExbB